ncbi:beta-ketoacyl-ACP synthase III [Marinilactibacillus psychrotolerans]|uniref:Beta-ketoacyl-[acyl-carrier-protein] synthase III n=1 Tax=Marinilactibacillus psychrotolerans TaxID=191770 RepID=A0AAV3WRQ8_9LACT|nr:beta-ketoacyl-ACP synthase III [Marinilactibacillus psychrotolerans]GEL67277.1 3-oxoacyl-[acyl-carrier-protein] synthase 3 [Marinilactibacillus psychrotolerans]GEQ36081.1 3-oxoacyl-ACP synthase 3 [Marinilactibacillus psychrotolerans]SDC62820.1 3-oxoacyl-[acyl-carrier-protein] synthase-3 [Marinilactibacillus psychrotolerans]
MSNQGKVRIRSVGKYIPKRILTNEDLTEWLDTSDEWITSRTGIKQRHISTTENTSDLCTEAALKALDKVKVKAEEVGLIIVATMSPDAHSPSVACTVQSNIQAENAMAFDINAACSGFVYACSVAEKMLSVGPYQYALVIGGEVMSKVVDWKDRSTAVLFGDGAGCVLLEKNNHTHSFIGEDIHADGSRGQSLTSGEVAVNNLLTSGNEVNPYLQMNGRDIFDFVVRSVPKSITEVVEANQLRLEEVDFFLLHQANARLIKAVSKKLKQPIEKFPKNIDQYGNTSAASIPILLEELITNGDIQLGSNQTIVLTGFGGGLTWGSLLIKL